MSDNSSDSGYTDSRQECIALPAENVEDETLAQLLNRDVHRALWGFGLSIHISNLLMVVWHIIDIIMVVHLLGRKLLYVESAIFLFGFPLYRGIPMVISYVSSHFIKHAVVHKRSIEGNVYFSHAIILCVVFAIVLIIVLVPLSPQLSDLLDGGQYSIQRHFGTTAMYLSAGLIPILSLFTHAADPILMIQGRYFLASVKSIILYSVAIVLLSYSVLFLYSHGKPSDPSHLLIYPLLAYCISSLLILVWMVAILSRVKLYGITYNNNLHLELKHFLPISVGILGILLLRSLPGILLQILQSITFLLSYRAYGNYYLEYESMIAGKLSFSIFSRMTSLTTLSSASFGTVVMYLVQLAYYSRRYDRARLITLWGSLYATITNAIICIIIFFTADSISKAMILPPDEYAMQKDFSTFNTDTFYSAISSALKSSALFYAPSGLYAVVLGSMQGSNYGPGALVLSFGKMVTIFSSLIVLMSFQRAEGIYTLAFGFGEAVGFILSIVGLVLQTKRLALFSRADTLTDLTISKVNGVPKSLHFYRKTKKPKKEKIAPVKALVGKQSKKQPNMMARFNVNTIESTNESNTIQCSEDCLLLSGKAILASASARSTDCFNTDEYSSACLSTGSQLSLSKRPTTQAIFRQNTQPTGKPILNTSLQVYEAKQALSSDQESAVENLSVMDPNTSENESM